MVDNPCTCYPCFKGRCDYGNDNKLIGDRVPPLVFRLFQSPASGTQHKAEDSVLLAVCDGHFEQSCNSLATMLCADWSTAASNVPA